MICREDDADDLHVTCFQKKWCHIDGRLLAVEEGQKWPREIKAWPQKCHEEIGSRLTREGLPPGIQVHSLPRGAQTHWTQTTSHTHVIDMRH